MNRKNYRSILKWGDPNHEEIVGHGTLEYSQAFNLTERPRRALHAGKRT